MNPMKAKVDLLKSRKRTYNKDFFIINKSVEKKWINILFCLKSVCVDSNSGWSSVYFHSCAEAFRNWTLLKRFHICSLWKLNKGSSGLDIGTMANYFHWWGNVGFNHRNEGCHCWLAPLWEDFWLSGPVEGCRHSEWNTGVTCSSLESHAAISRGSGKSICTIVVCVVNVSWQR